MEGKGKLIDSFQRGIPNANAKRKRSTIWIARLRLLSLKSTYAKRVKIFIKQEGASLKNTRKYKKEHFVLLYLMRKKLHLSIFTLYR